MNLPRLRGKADPDNGGTTAEWLIDDPTEARPYFGELRPSGDERAEQAEARAELAEQERDGISVSLDEARAARDVERRKVRVLADEVARLTELTLPTLPGGAAGDPVLPDVPEHDLTPVEVGSTPLDTPETDWDSWSEAWDALTPWVPGAALAQLEAES